MVPHNDSTDLVRDCARSVSDASQNDTDESAVREISFVPDSPSGSVSSPSLDDESGNHTTISPQSQSMTPFETMNELASLTPSPRSKAGLVTQFVVPLPLPNGRFKCPKCPRPFPGLGDASRHLQAFRHAHVCLVSHCNWSYESLKDLLRHSARHDPHARRYPCPVLSCRPRRRGSDNTFSRPDLLKRHMKEFHS